MSLSLEDINPGFLLTESIFTCKFPGLIYTPNAKGELNPITRLGFKPRLPESPLRCSTISVTYLDHQVNSADLGTLSQIKVHTV
jgi:hypothetical protein